MTRPVKWETIKAKAVLEANAFTFGRTGYIFPAEAMLDAIAERRSLWSSVDALRALIAKRILAWDVRACSRLRELFPQAFPPGLRHGPLTAFLDEAGDWVIDRP